MKKVILMVLSLTLIFMCGCSYLNYERQNFSQKVTIVKMPSPPKCKTTDNTSVVNDVIAVLSEIEKTPIEEDNINGGWNIMVKLNIDKNELVYTVGNIFTDSDGRQYKVSNYEEIQDKLNKIYNELDVVEVDYP